MNAEKNPSSFRDQVQSRIDAAEESLEQRRQQMEREMAELEERRRRCQTAADQIIAQVLSPLLQEIAQRFENARLDDTGGHPRIECRLLHCLRFPAVASVGFSLLPGTDASDRILVQYRAEILPVFIRFERSDEFSVSLDDGQLESLRQWAETKLLGFLDAYLQIETHRHYQSNNVATDPVCGMQIPKPQAIVHEFDGNAYYFCTNQCAERFAAEPIAFVNAS